MSKINKRQLLKLIRFLPPLLQGIHFSHPHSTLQIHIVSIINTLQDFYMDHIWCDMSMELDDQLIFNIESESVRELFQKRFDLFKKIPLRLPELFFDEFIKKWEYDVRPEDPWVQEFCIQVGEEVEKCLIPLSYFYSRDQEMKRVTETNTSRSELLEYLMNYTKRIGVSVEEYMNLFSSNYPLLLPIYTQLSYHLPSSSALQRSFSTHVPFLSP